MPGPVVPDVISPLLQYNGCNSKLFNDPSGSKLSISGVSKDGSILWVTSGPYIEVLLTKTRNRIASWTFGALLKDTNTSIVCVKEYKFSGASFLLIGVNSTSENGLLCLFDIKVSRVIKAIEIPHQVTCIEAVMSQVGDAVPMWAVNIQLRQFYGIAAVGTLGGMVYLIDLCMDEDLDVEVSDEVNASKLQYISPRSRDIPEKRVQALERGQQLCMVLDEEISSSEFQYRRCDGTVLKTFSSEDVEVTFLLYIPQIGNVVVGFNFGCYQLWKLHTPVLEYSSRLENEDTLVSHICYQEPENDPKNFCYLWICRNPNIPDNGVASMSLYQLAYQKKTWYSRYGAFYEDLSSVSLRFDLALTSSVVPSVDSSKVITLYTVQDPKYRPPCKLSSDDSFEENLLGPDLSICVIAWLSNQGQETTPHLAIFDINRWYHAQMPSSLRRSNGTVETCSFLATWCLESALDDAPPESVLSVFVGSDRIRRFTTTGTPSEQFFHPASLSFDLVILTKYGLVKVRYLGNQRQIIRKLQKSGPSMLLNARDALNQCYVAGLTSVPSISADKNESYMREIVLNFALENNLVNVIISCIQEWAAGEFINYGCTLKWLLDWAWERISYIKASVDNTCTCLYDWSGMTLDKLNLTNLKKAQLQLQHLASIFKFLLSQSGEMTDRGLKDLHSRLMALTYLIQHIKVTLWFVRAGLLPEFDDADDEQEDRFCYPSSNLVHAYSHRRKELKKISVDESDADMLMIDGYVNQLGVSIENLWNQEGGNGQYPPPSLHALLCTYLLDGIDTQVKNGLVLYLLLDLVSLSPPHKSAQFAEKITSFTSAFDMQPSLVKQIQGFWLLDHADYEEAVSVLLSPAARCELGHWQHQRVIQSLLFQGESKLALQYLNSVRPSLASPEEIKLKLTVLLACGLTGHALEYLRECSDHQSKPKLLEHLFLGCQEMKTLEQVMQLPLSEFEEQHLVKFLSESSSPYAKELLVLYFLESGKYMEAVQINERMKKPVMLEVKSKTRERATTRNAIVDGYTSILSNVQRELLSKHSYNSRKPVALRRTVKRPQPLSTTVTKVDTNKFVSKSGLFFDVVDHMEGTRDDKKESEPQGEEENADNIGLFIATPITPKVESRLCERQATVFAEQEKLKSPLPSFAINTPVSGTKLVHQLSVKKRLSVYGASALSLLDTPQVLKKTPPRKKMSLSNVSTPQSILKVKQVISPTSAEPRSGQPFSVGKSVTKRLGFTSQTGTPRSVSFVDTPSVTPTRNQFAEPEKQKEPETPSGPLSKSNMSTDSVSLDESMVSADEDIGVDESLAVTSSPGSPIVNKNSSAVSSSTPPTHLSVSLHQNTLSPKKTSPVLSVQVAEVASSDVPMAENDDEFKKIDDEITFHYGIHHSGDENQSKTIAEDSMDVDEGMEGKQTTLPASPAFGVFTSLKDKMARRPIHLDKSSSLTKSPRSPTVKLTASSARSKYIPKFNLETDEKISSSQDAQKTTSESDETNKSPSSSRVQQAMDAISTSISPKFMEKIQSSPSVSPTNVKSVLKIVVSYAPSDVDMVETQTKSGTGVTEDHSTISDNESVKKDTQHSEICSSSIPDSLEKSPSISSEANEPLTENEMTSTMIDNASTEDHTNVLVEPKKQLEITLTEAASSDLLNVLSEKSLGKDDFPEEEDAGDTSTDKPSEEPKTPTRRSSRRISSFKSLASTRESTTSSKNSAVDSRNEKLSEIKEEPVTPPKDQMSESLDSSGTKADIAVKKEEAGDGNNDKEEMKTPTRKKSRKTLTKEEPTQPEEGEELQTPSRRKTRPESLAKDQAEDIRRTPRRGRPSNTDKLKDDEQQPIEPRTPTRRSKKSESLSRDDAEEIIKDVKKTPTRRRSKNAGTPSRDESNSKEISEDVKKTPTRKSKKAATPRNENERDILEDNKKTPTRRGKRATTPSRNESDEEQITKEVKRTPTRRSKRAATPSRNESDEEEITKEVKRTPTRRSKRATTPSRNESDEEQITKEDKRTSTRRSKRAATPSRNESDEDEITKEVKRTPTRRSNRATTPSRDEDESILPEDIKKASTRKKPKTTPSRTDNLSSDIEQTETTTKTSAVTPTTDIDDVVETPKKTPTRRSLRATLSDKGEENTEGQEPKTEEDAETSDAVNETKAIKTPTRKRGQHPHSEQEQEGDLAPEHESQTPTRRKSRGNTPSRDDTSNVTAEEISLLKSPGRRKSKAAGQEPEKKPIEEEQLAEPLTPTRRKSRGSTPTREIVRPDSPARKQKKIDSLRESTFTFSDPALAERLASGTIEDKPATPLKDFFFSPPITRSVRKILHDEGDIQSKDMEAVEEEPVDSLSEFVHSQEEKKMEEEKHTVMDKKESKAPTRNRRKKTLEDEKIHLISPLSQDSPVVKKRITRLQARKLSKANEEADTTKKKRTKKSAILW